MQYQAEQATVATGRAGRVRGIRLTLTRLLILITAALGISAVTSAPAFAGTNDYPTSIGGCRSASNPGGGSFTCNLKDSSSDTLIDPWNEYNRECTSFAAWRLHARNGFEMPFNDDAAGWGPDARNRGYAVDMTPSVGAIAWWSSGHVAWVESVSGSNVTVEEYNYNFTHLYSERTIAASSVSGYIHFRDLATDLFFVKTRNTGSGHVEVHSATANSGYQAGQHDATWFGTGDQSNGYFQMVGTDLFFIKTRNTGYGVVEIHSATAASGYQNGQHNTTSFSIGDQDNGWFQMEDVDGDGRQDLVFIKTHNTGSYRIEVHWRTAASNFQSGLDVATDLSEADANNGWFQLVGRDLYFIKTYNTGSGHVEVHGRTYGSGYMSGVDTATWFGAGDQSNGWFQMTGSGLFFVKTRNTGSGQVELHSATAGTGYQSGQHNVTWFSTGDQSNGWFQVGDK